MIKTQLFKHQQEAFDKLVGVKVGALFMDMGTGKTLVSLKLYEKRYTNGKVNKLVYLCPISSKDNLIEEITKHTDLVFKTDYFIFGIDSISMSDRIYLEVLEFIDDKTMLVIDESTYIKNPYAKRTERAIEISKKCYYKLIMTGTPITKFVKDLWGQFYFLSPLILGYKSYSSFANNHLEYDKTTRKIKRSCNISYLTKKMSPYIFEKEIDEIADMPMKNYITKHYYLNPNTIHEYNNVTDKILNGLSELSASTVTIYNLFTALQKCISFDEKRIEILKSVIEEIDLEKQIIIWVKYKKEITMITKMLKTNYAIFDGNNKEENEFKKGNKRFLIANLQTGSHAQNFQNCYYQIFYSNNFDYATREQAERRTWRTGQKNKCVYIDIRSNTGMEDIIFTCLFKKKKLIETFLDLAKEYNIEYLKEYLKKELVVKEDKHEVISK